jgi:hypothetical protein
MSKEVIRKLAARFKVSHEAFNRPMSWKLLRKKAFEDKKEIGNLKCEASIQAHKDIMCL